jgi:DNA-directed RNA polymerase subunit E'/Rpb7
MDALFVRSLLRDATLMKPQYLGSNYREVLQQQVRRKVEGICTRHGFIMPNSVSLHRVSPGRVEGVSLNGDVRFDVQYHALVCNPPVGAVLHARVVNTNRFGVLAHAGVLKPDGEFLPVVEAIATKQAITGPDASEVDLDSLSVGDEVHIEVLGKKFELNDDRISVIARVLKKQAQTSASGRAAAEQRAKAAAAATLMPPLRFVDSDAFEDVDLGSDAGDSGGGEDAGHDVGEQSDSGDDDDAGLDDDKDDVDEDDDDEAESKAQDRDDASEDAPVAEDEDDSDGEVETDVEDDEEDANDAFFGADSASEAGSGEEDGLAR